MTAHHPPPLSPPDPPPPFSVTALQRTYMVWVTIKSVLTHSCQSEATWRSVPGGSVMFYDPASLLLAVELVR